jgi:FtsZ-binding cell division protein ZapB
VSIQNGEEDRPAAASGAERQRAHAEHDRERAEDGREVAEDARETADEWRDERGHAVEAAEAGRVTAEELREHREALRQSAEALRGAAEELRREREGLRELREEVRGYAESVRRANEEARIRAEDARQAMADAIAEQEMIAVIVAYPEFAHYRSRRLVHLVRLMIRMHRVENAPRSSAPLTAARAPSAGSATRRSRDGVAPLLPVAGHLSSLLDGDRVGLRVGLHAARAVRCNGLFGAALLPPQRSIADRRAGCRARVPRSKIQRTPDRHDRVEPDCRPKRDTGHS